MGEQMVKSDRAVSSGELEVLQVRIHVFVEIEATSFDELERGGGRDGF